MRACSAGFDDASRRASSRTGTARSSCSNSREEEESLGAERPGFALGKQIRRDRSRARPLPGSEVRTRGGQRPPAAVVKPTRRRQPECVLCQLGRLQPTRRARVASAAASSSRPRDVGVRRVGRERDVAGGEDRVVDDLGDPGVNAPPLVAQVGVEDRRQQRVGEADHPVLALDHARGDRGIERVRGERPPAPGARPTSCRRRPRAQARCEWTQGAPRSSRSRALRASREPQAAAAGRRPPGRMRASSSAKNGFPPDRSWIRSSVWRGNEVPSRSRSKRWSAPTLSGPDDEPPDAVRAERAFELRLMRAFGQPPRQQKADRARVEPPQGERERTRRGRSRATERRRRRSEPVHASLRSCSTSRTATASVRSIDRIT